MRWSRGMTLLEMIVIVLVVAALAGMLFVATRNAQERARRSSCMSNVRNIGATMFTYAACHEEQFMPLVDAAGNRVPAVDNAGVVSNLPARTAFAVLLSDGYLITMKVFLCPSSGAEYPEGFPTDFKKALLASLILPEESCSYGWDPTKTHTADPACAILADRPSANVSVANEGSARNNSNNHRGQGQIVFYNDGHCKWSTTPAPDCGDDPDIYTGAAGYEKSLTDAKIVR